MVNINDLIKDLNRNAERLDSLEDVINEYFSESRCMTVADIEPEVGIMIENLIRFFNYQDRELNIPIELRRPIKIYIDSMGGDLSAAFTIIDAIQLSDTPVWTINIGAAYSGGFLIFIAGHKRYCYPHSSFLLHEGSAGTSGTAIQFENFSAHYKRQLKQLKALVLSKTAITEEKYNEICKDDFWLLAEDAVELNIADEILTYLI